MTTPFDLTLYQDPLTIQRILRSAKTIAIVGLSKNRLRASYFVGFYLQRHGYTIIPVNPRETEILGERCYPSLVDVPVPIDVVNVFRAPDALPAIAARSGHGGSQGAVVSVHGDQRGRRAHRRVRRPVRRDGPLHQSRARALRRPDALARVQYAEGDVGAGGTPVRVLRVLRVLGFSGCSFYMVQRTIIGEFNRVLRHARAAVELSPRTLRTTRTCRTRTLSTSEP